jgi:hypothetical protein
VGALASYFGAYTLYGNETARGRFHAGAPVGAPVGCQNGTTGQRV